MKRFTVTEIFEVHIGACSLIWDHRTRRRILVAGVDHQAKAAQRAAQLEAEARRQEEARDDA